jgi:hypothetical protein
MNCQDQIKVIKQVPASPSFPQIDEAEVKIPLNLFFLVARNLFPRLKTRIARWYFFKPKLPNYVNFGGPWNEKGWYFCGHLEYYAHLVI